MSWLFLAGLGIIWAACCFPRGMRSPRTTVQEFERGMDMLADVGHKDAGRFILAPRKGRPFLGTRERARARARARRRRVLTFLLEAIGLTGLMGLFPPLRPMLYATGAFVTLFIAYLGVLVWIKEARKDRARYMRHALGGAVVGRELVASDGNGNGNGHRYVSGSGSGHARPTYNGLGLLGEGDVVHVQVRSARGLRLA